MGETNENKKKKSNFIHELAKLVCQKFNVHYYKGQLLWQDDLMFSSNRKALLKEISKSCQISANKWNDLKVILPCYAKWVDEDINFHIQLENGIIENGLFMDPLDSDKFKSFTIFNLPISYNGQAYDEHVDKFLDFISCDRKDLRNVLEEIVGHILLTKDFPHNFFFLTGKGSNGKSTFIEMLKGFAGHLTSCVDFEDFNSLTFVHQMIGKLINICDDADNIHLEKAKNLKAMASGNSITAKALYEAPVTMVNSATLIFTSNDPPSFKDKSFGLIRRLKVIPFEATIKEVEYGFLDRLTTKNAKEYLLRLGLEGIYRIFKNKMQISKADCIDKATRRYHIDNDSVLSWLEENPICIETELRTAYIEYNNWCREGGLKPVNIKHFSRRIQVQGYETFRRWSGNEIKNVRFVIPPDNSPDKILETAL